MRFTFPATLMLSLVVCQTVVAAEDLGPKATIATWTRDGATWTSEQILNRLYFAQTTRERTFAKAMASQTLASCKLQDAVLKKWGKAAEQAFARATMTDVVEDDQAATEKIDGDHATVTFLPETQIDVAHLIKVDGTWKVDLKTVLTNLGDGAAGSLRFFDQSSHVLQSAFDKLNAGQFKESGELVDFVKKEFEKLSQ